MNRKNWKNELKRLVFGEVSWIKYTVIWIFLFIVDQFVSQNNIIKGKYPKIDVFYIIKSIHWSGIVPICLLSWDIKLIMKMKCQKLNRKKTVFIYLKLRIANPTKIKQQVSSKHICNAPNMSVDKNED